MLLDYSYKIYISDSCRLSLNIPSHPVEKYWKHRNGSMTQLMPSHMLFPVDAQKGNLEGLFFWSWCLICLDVLCCFRASHWCRPRPSRTHWAGGTGLHREWENKIPLYTSGFGLNWNHWWSICWICSVLSWLHGMWSKTPERWSRKLKCLCSERWGRVGFQLTACHSKNLFPFNTQLSSQTSTSQKTCRCHGAMPCQFVAPQCFQHHESEASAARP